MDNPNWIEEVSWNPNFDFEKTKKFVLLDKIAVLANYTGRGIGSKIYKRFMNDMNTLGYKYLFSETIIDPIPNFASLSFRKKQSYKLAGMRYEKHDGVSYADLIYYKPIDMIKIDNHWTIEQLIEVFRAAKIYNSWQDVHSEINLRFTGLIFSDDVIEHLLSTPFSKQVTKRIFELLNVLNCLVTESNENGGLSASGKELLNDRFVGIYLNNAWLSINFKACINGIVIEVNNINLAGVIAGYINMLRGYNHIFRPKAYINNFKQLMGICIIKKLLKASISRKFCIMYPAVLPVICCQRPLSACQQSITLLALKMQPVSWIAWPRPRLC